MARLSARGLRFSHPICAPSAALSVSLPCATRPSARRCKGSRTGAGGAIHDQAILSPVGRWTYPSGLFICPPANRRCAKGTAAGSSWRRKIYGCARPSLIRIWPASRPPSDSDPHRRQKLHLGVPSCPGGQAHATRVRRASTLAIRARRRVVALSARRRSSSITLVVLKEFQLELSVGIRRGVKWKRIRKELRIWHTLCHEQAGSIFEPSREQVGRHPWDRSR
jgi:hypothetical protein